MAAKDYDRVASFLHPSIDFRGITPGAVWEAGSPEEVVEKVLRDWYADHDNIDAVVSVETGRIGKRNRVSYVLAVSNADGPFVVEQHAYYEEKDGKIKWMRFLCSGWQPRDER